MAVVKSEDVLCCRRGSFLCWATTISRPAAFRSSKSRRVDLIRTTLHGSPLLPGCKRIIVHRHQSQSELANTFSPTTSLHLTLFWGCVHFTCISLHLRASHMQVLHSITQPLHTAITCLHRRPSSKMQRTWSCRSWAPRDPISPMDHSSSRARARSEPWPPS